MADYSTLLLASLKKRKRTSRELTLLSKNTSLEIEEAFLHFRYSCTHRGFEKEWQTRN